MLADCDFDVLMMQLKILVFSVCIFFLPKLLNSLEFRIQVSIRSNIPFEGVSKFHKKNHIAYLPVRILSFC